MSFFSLQGQGQYSQIFGGYSTLFAVVAAVISAIIAWRQLKANAKISEKATAHQVHSELLKLCIQYPELSSSSLFKKYLNKSSLKGVSSFLSHESEKGLWFLSYVLFCLEQLYFANDKNDKWNEVIKSQIDFHRETLESVWNEYKCHYDEEFVDFVNKELLIE